MKLASNYLRLRYMKVWKLSNELKNLYELQFVGEYHELTWASTDVSCKTRINWN